MTHPLPESPRGRERPILFSGPMVRAILDGRKTQTRRAMKPQPDTAPGMNCTRLRFKDRKGRMTLDVAAEVVNEHGVAGSVCPYGGVGDRLWVREAWADTTDLFKPETAMLRYRADGEHPFAWRPSIFMPRWASRITLEITDVRVERVQDISEPDAQAEGVETVADIDYSRGRTYAAAFRDLWNAINAPRGYGWDANPHVWAITFRRIEEDARGR